MRNKKEKQRTEQEFSPWLSQLPDAVWLAPTHYGLYHKILSSPVNKFVSFSLPYNSYYSAYFFSRNSVFLSQQFSQNSVFQPISAKIQTSERDHYGIEV